MTLLALESIFERKVLFVSGKGGTGKSTFAILLSKYASELGKKVLLVEQSSHAILPFFTGENKDFDYANLGLENCFREFVCSFLNQPFLYEKVFNSEALRTFLRTIPGLAETMVLGKLYYSMEKDKNQPYDLVVFDCPASGHFFNLLMTPNTIKTSALGGPFMEYVHEIDSYIRSEKIGVVIMALPEPLVANETVELARKITSEGFNLDCLVKNKWLGSDPSMLESYENYPNLKRFLVKDIQKQFDAEEILSSLSCVTKEAGTRIIDIPFNGSIRPPLGNNRIEDFLGPFV